MFALTYNFIDAARVLGYLMCYLVRSLYRLKDVSETLYCVVTLYLEK